MTILLDNLDKLTVINQTSSYIRCVCPVCNGNLKISLSNHAYGAYKCYDNECSPKDIREAIGLVDTKNYYLSPYKQEISRSVYTDNQLTKKIESAKPVSLSCPTELIRCNDYVPIQSTTRNFVNGSKKRTTIYPYSSHQRVYRLDSYNPPDKKQIYLQYLAEDGSWQVGNGPKTWQVYQYGLDLTQSGNTILGVEGEKTAEYVKENYGIACITFASPCYVTDYLYRILFLFFGQNQNLKQLIYVPDHDDPGYLKAKKVQQVCNYLKKPCQIISVKDFLQLPFEPDKGSDLADFNVLIKGIPWH